LNKLGVNDVTQTDIHTAEPLEPGQVPSRLSWLLKINGVNDVRQTEIHTTESLMPEPSAFEFEMITEKGKDTNHRYRSNRIRAD
jgi:hypothetical protein